LERHRSVVRQGDVEGSAVHVLRPGRAADGAIMLGAAIGGADDQRLAQPVAQRLQLVERLLVDAQATAAAAGDLRRREVLPAPAGGRHVAPVFEGGGRHGWSPGTKKPAERRGGGLRIGGAGQGPLPNSFSLMAMPGI